MKKFKDIQDFIIRNRKAGRYLPRVGRGLKMQIQDTDMPQGVILNARQVFLAFVEETPGIFTVAVAREDDGKGAPAWGTETHFTLDTDICELAAEYPDNPDIDRIIHALLFEAEASPQEVKILRTFSDLKDFIRSHRKAGQTHAVLPAHLYMQLYESDYAQAAVFSPLGNPLLKFEERNMQDEPGAFEVAVSTPDRPDVIVGRWVKFPADSALSKIIAEFPEGQDTDLAVAALLLREAL